MENLVAIAGWLITTFAPQLNTYWNIVLAVLKVADALKDAFGSAPADALKRALDIQLRIHKPTPEEEQVMFDRGFQKADENHDFAYTMN